MILAEEVRDINGRMLLGKGMRIEQSHIRILKMWGVTEVHVGGDIGIKDKPELHINPELIEKTKEKLKPIFVHVDLDHPAIKEIFRLSVEYRTNTDQNSYDAGSLETLIWGDTYYWRIDANDPCDTFKGPVAGFTIGCPLGGQPAADLNDDCQVNYKDFAEAAYQWSGQDNKILWP